MNSYNLFSGGVEMANIPLSQNRSYSVIKISGIVIVTIVTNVVSNKATE